MSIDKAWGTTKLLLIMIPLFYRSVHHMALRAGGYVARDEPKAKKPTAEIELKELGKM